MDDAHRRRRHMVVVCSNPNIVSISILSLSFLTFFLIKGASIQTMILIARIEFDSISEGLQSAPGKKIYDA